MEIPDFIPTSTLTPSPTFVPTSTLFPTISPTQLSPTWTANPTLRAEEAEILLNNLLENNTGCRLPCFWGITPGWTTWQETKSFLETFTLLLDVRNLPNQIHYAYFQIPFPKEMGTIAHTYKFNNGIVENIRVYNGDLSPKFYLPAFFQNYGQPTSVWIRTFREEEQNSRPFILDVFYEDQGILMEYSGGELIDQGESLKNCLDNRLDSPFIYLWSPNNALTFKEAKDMFLDTENLPEPISLEEATGMGVSTFYESIRDTGSVCIETPKDLWP